MKNLFVIILSVFAFSFAYSQDHRATFTSNSSEYQKNKSKGIYLFSVDSKEYTIEKINKSAGFYKDHFNVTSKKKDGAIAIQVVLKGVNQQNIGVLKRFFVSLGIKEVLYKNETFQMNDFTNKYL